MKIYRFSYDGFEPKRQSHHYDYLAKFVLDDEFFEGELAKCGDNTYVEKVLCEQRSQEQEFFANGALSDIEYGIWVFTSRRFSRRSLNHLEKIPPLWEADIAEDVLAYDVDFHIRGSIADIPGAECVGCFLPAASCQGIENARKVPYRYEGAEYKDFYQHRCR